MDQDTRCQPNVGNMEDIMSTDRKICEPIGAMARLLSKMGASHLDEISYHLDNSSYDNHVDSFEDGIRMAWMAGGDPLWKWEDENGDLYYLVGTKAELVDAMLERLPQTEPVDESNTEVED